MFIFGHLGIGNKLVSPWSEDLPKAWIFVGALLPDLIDKPLYYGLSFLSGRSGAELGLISGTRTFGHTAIFLLVLTGIGIFRRSRLLAALCLGVASHLLLDNLGDHFMGLVDTEASTVVALLFPFLGYRFPVYPFTGTGDHLASVLHPYVLIGEIVGLLLLGWEYWKSAHRGEILEFLKLKRLTLRRRRHRD